MFIWLCSLSCETINSGNRNCPWLFCLILGVFPCARLPSPALILWKMSSLIVTLYDMFYWYQREACCFLKKNGGRVDLGKRGWHAGMRREKIWNQDAICERTRKENKTEQKQKLETKGALLFFFSGPLSQFPKTLLTMGHSFDCVLTLFHCLN